MDGFISLLLRENRCLTKACTGSWQRVPLTVKPVILLNYKMEIRSYQEAEKLLLIFPLCEGLITPCEPPGLMAGDHAVKPGRTLTTVSCRDDIGTIL